MFTRNVAKLSLAVLSALVITAGPSIAKADDSAAEREFQLEWLAYQLQNDYGGPGPAPTRESVMRAMAAKDNKDSQLHWPRRLGIVPSRSDCGMELDRQFMYNSD